MDFTYLGTTTPYDKNLPSDSEVIDEFLKYAYSNSNADIRGFYITASQGRSHGIFYMYTDGVIRLHADVECGGPIAFWETQELADEFLANWRDANKSIINAIQ